MQLEFLIDIIIALAAGFVIGAERESRGKPAGIYVIYISLLLLIQIQLHV